MSKEILNIEMQPNDANSATIGGYLQKLLASVWENGECFDGKRPFGNSGWEYELYQALAMAGKIKHTYDDIYDDYDNYDKGAANKLISEAIKSLLMAE